MTASEHGHQTAATLSGAEPSLRMLRLLARRNAVAVPMPGGKHVSIAVAAEDGSQHPAAGTFPRQIFEAAEKLGWLARGCDLKWRITAHGRTQLRRALSRTPAGKPAPGKPTAVPGGAGKAVFNPCESPLGWLRHRRGAGGVALISEEQFAAGERLRADYWYAGLSPRVTASWSVVAPCSRGAGGAGDLADNTLAARERVNRALAAVGPELSGILVDVCCHLRGLEQVERRHGWSPRSAKIVLQLALTGLARHYGLLGWRDSHPSLRHWGTADYRPALDGDAGG